MPSLLPPTRCPPAVTAARLTPRRCKLACLARAAARLPAPSRADATTQAGPPARRPPVLCELWPCVSPAGPPTRSRAACRSPDLPARSRRGEAEESAARVAAGSRAAEAAGTPPGVPATPEPSAARVAAGMSADDGCGGGEWSAEDDARRCRRGGCAPAVAGGSCLREVACRLGVEGDDRLGIGRGKMGKERNKIDKSLLK